MEVDDEKTIHHGQVIPLLSIAATKGRRKWIFLRSLAKALWPGTCDTSAATYALQELGLENSVVLHMAREHPGLSDDDWQTLLAVYKKHLADPLAGSSARRLSLVPLKVAIRVGRNRGALGFLRSLNHEVATPEKMFEVYANNVYCEKAEQKALAADADEDKAAAQTLSQEMLAYERQGDDDEGGAAGGGSVGRPRKIALEPGKTLSAQLAAFALYRKRRLDPTRAGGAAADSTIEAEHNTCLRFLGWLRTREQGANKERKRYTLKVFRDAAVAKHIQDYLEELTTAGRAWSTAGDYCNALHSIICYVERNEEVASQAQLATWRLRQQCDKQAKQDGVWRKRKKNWITWEQAQEARVIAIQRYRQYKGGSRRKKAGLCRTALVVALHTILPVDRVGVLRRLCLDKTLVEDDLDYAIDLRGTREWGKTAKMFGP